MALFSASGGNFILLVSQWWWWECSTVEHRAISLSDPNYRGQLWDTERGRHAWTCVQHLDNLTHTHTPETGPQSTTLVSHSVFAND